MKVIIIFAIATIINVVLSTMRSLMTINAGKWVAAIMNAICYGFYTWVVVLTVSNFDLWLKILITAVANFLGVWVVKFIEEKSRKDKMWKVEVAIPRRYADKLHFSLQNLPHNYVEVGSWVMFNCYCETQKDTQMVVDLAKFYDGKISAYESKGLGV